MGIFGKRIVLKINDPEFGWITFGRVVWWSSPKDNLQTFGISIAAPESGPSEVQRQFYREILANLAKWQESALSFIKAHAGNHVDVKQLSVYSIGVGTEDECRQGKFDLEFADHQADEIHIVWFEAGQPYEYGCDD